MVRNIKLIASLLGSMLLCAWIYWPAAQGDFVFDDYPNIVDNKTIQLKGYSIDQIREAAYGFSSGPIGRPVSNLTFATNYYFFGLHPGAFKLVNIFLHLLNGLILFFLAKEFISEERSGLSESGVGWAAWLLASLWLMHPINGNLIYLVVQRMTQLATLFIFFGCFALLRYKNSAGNNRWLWLALALLSFPLAVLSKETGFLAFVFVALYMGGGIQNAKMRRYFLVLVLGLVMLLAMVTIGYAEKIFSGYAYRNFSPVERLLTESRVLFAYLKLIFFPVFQAYGLQHDDVVVSRGLLEPPTTLLALLGWFGILIVILKVKNRWLTFAVLWFLLAHSLESTVLPLELMHEHRNYVALVGPLLAISVATVLYAEGAHSTVRTLVLCLTAAGSMWLIFSTYMRTQQNSNEFRRSALEVAFHPESERANIDYAIKMLDIGLQKNSDFALGEAIFYFNKAKELNSESLPASVGLLNLECARGNGKGEGFFDTLRILSNEKVLPSSMKVFQGIVDNVMLGGGCLGDRRVEELFSSFLRNPYLVSEQRAIVLTWYADYLFLRKNNTKEALSAIQDGLVLEPDSWELHRRKIELLLGVGDYESVKKEISNLKWQADSDVMKRNQLNGYEMRVKQVDLQ